jgi:hypothetical protein
MNDYVNAWQCIGCGRIDGPQPCVGICQDRKVEFVYASEHEEILAQLALARRQASALDVLVRRLARTNPRKDGWERSYRAMQEQARSTLAALGSAAPDLAGR